MCLTNSSIGPTFRRSRPLRSGAADGLGKCGGAAAIIELPWAARDLARNLPDWRALNPLVPSENSELTMADDKNLRGSADRSRINMGEDYEVRYWVQELGVDRHK